MIFESAKWNRWKRRVLTLLLVCAETAVLLAVVEGGLRLWGYGYTTHPFIAKQYDGDTWYLLNDRYYRQFFSGGNQTPNAFEVPNTTVVRKTKPAKTYRIFLFGSSAAYGWFFPEYNMGNLLETMLRDRFPQCRFEVVTVAFHAMNSFTMRYLAEMCAEMQPDLFLVYMGNNEMVGPYGFESVFGKRCVSASAMERRVRMNLFLSNVKLYQLVEAPAQRLFSGSVAGLRWGEYAGITAIDDPRLERAYTTFRHNLDDICESAQRAGAKTALCTVGYNLADWRPTASAHRKPLTDSQSAEWDRNRESGKRLEAARDYAEAIRAYRNAVSIDDTHAELLYDLGRCYRATGDFARARQCFRQAVDNALSFCSANTRINAVIAQTAEARNGTGAVFVDTAKALADHAADGIPGRDFFHDHVHLTFEGNYCIAAEMVRAIAPLARKKLGLSGCDAPPPIEECMRRIGYSPAVRLNEIRRVLQTYTKADDPIAIHLKEVQSRLEAEVGPDVDAAVYEGNRQALALDPENTRIRYACVIHMNQSGHAAETLDDVRRLVKEAPCNWQYKTALMWAAAEKKTGEERRQYEELLALYPEFPGIQESLGRFIQSTHDLDKAEKHFRKALAMNDRNPRFWSALAGNCALRGRFDDALSYIKKALKLEPAQLDDGICELRNAFYSFQNANEWPNAVSALKTCLQLKPDLDSIRPRLADALCRIKDFDAAWKEIATCRQKSVDIPADILDRLKRESGREQ